MAVPLSLVAKYRRMALNELSNVRTRALALPDRAQCSELEGHTHSDARVVSRRVSLQVVCGGERMLAEWNCVSDGYLCSDHGTCVNNVCQCDDGYKGTYCQSETSSDSIDVGHAAGLVRLTAPRSHIHIYASISDCLII
jgi:hypothetical protein